jgi:hypothetical protein
MTAAETARGIADYIIGKSFYRGEQSEARLIGVIETALLDAKREAYEDAAQIADADSNNDAYSGYTYIARRVAKAIRAKKGELK